MLCLIALFLGNVILWCTTLWFIVNDVANLCLICGVKLTNGDEFTHVANFYHNRF